MSASELRIVVFDIGLPALALIGIMVYAGRRAWIRYRGQVLGEVEAHAQCEYFGRAGPRRILVKRNVARGRVARIDLVFRGTDRISTVEAEAVPQLIQAIERAAQTSGDARGLDGKLFGTFTDLEVRALPAGGGRWTPCLSFLIEQAEGPDIPVYYLLTSAHATALVHLLRVATARA